MKRSGMGRLKAVELLVVCGVAAVFVGLPLYTQTSTYPLAIVQGNSMYPTLHNGDLVIFGKAPQQEIPNDTIIVFVQGDTGVSALDSIVRPVVIHRIVGIVIQADGTVYYRTKGDNNAYPDPSLVEANHVLGVPIAVVPDVGILVLFFESPQGLVALIGLISLYYVGKYEVRLRDDGAKDRLLADFTRLVFDGEMAEATFRRLEMAVKYGRELRPEAEDALTGAVLAWIRGGALQKGWGVASVECPACSGNATEFACPSGLKFTYCAREAVEPATAPVAR